MGPFFHISKIFKQEKMSAKFEFQFFYTAYLYINAAGVNPEILKIEIAATLNCKIFGMEMSQTIQFRYQISLKMLIFFRKWQKKNPFYG